MSGLSERERRIVRDALVEAWRDDYSVESIVNDGLSVAVGRIKDDAVAAAREEAAQAVEERLTSEEIITEVGEDVWEDELTMAEREIASLILGSAARLIAADIRKGGESRG